MNRLPCIDPKFIADLDIRVLKLNHFYEGTLVMTKLPPELRKCLTNICSIATSIF